MTPAARCGDNNNCAKTEKNLVYQSLVFFQNVFYNILFIN